MIGHAPNSAFTALRKKGRPNQRRRCHDPPVAPMPAREVCRHDRRTNNDFDYLIMFATAARLVGSRAARKHREATVSGRRKLNLMFEKPVRWKHSSDSDAAFRFVYSVSSVDEYEQRRSKLDATTSATCRSIVKVRRAAAWSQRTVPTGSFFQEPFVELDNVEDQVRDTLFNYIDPELRLRRLMPKDLQELFLFPGGKPHDADRRPTVLRSQLCRRPGDRLLSFWWPGQRVSLRGWHLPLRLGRWYTRLHVQPTAAARRWGCVSCYGKLRFQVTSDLGASKSSLISIALPDNPVFQCFEIIRSGMLGTLVIPPHDRHASNQ